MRIEKRIDTFISLNRKKELESRNLFVNRTPIDFGDLCTECERDTSYGTGLFLFANRIPSTMEHESPDGKFEIRDGWMCWECQQVECDQCPVGELTLEYEIVDGTILCPSCLDNQVSIGSIFEDPDNGFFHYRD